MKEIDRTFFSAGTFLAVLEYLIQKDYLQAMMLQEQHSSQTSRGRMKKKCRTIIEGNAKKAEDLARRHGENAAADLAEQVVSEESLI